ncbi:MAG: enoyl-CoA hydratase-related protein [Steroidobacteraceae bacterium]|jgi:enoyl-CoA hydratase/carnithine racemase
MSENVHVTRRGAVCELRLNRPDKRNALTLEMYRALGEALQAAELDPQVRAVLFSGEGACFTAGNDLNDFLAGPAFDDPAHPTVRFVHALPAFSKPLVCAVHGPTVGIGVTLLLHCDLVIAARRSTRLLFSFVSLGLVPEAASTLLLPRLLGQQRAAELLLLGEPLDAPTAQAWGLVNRVVDDAELLQEAREVADALAQQPPEALRRTKRLLRLDPQGEVRERMGVEVSEFAACLRGEEFAAAVRAFFAQHR